MVEPYLHSLTCFHCIVLNLLGGGITSLLPYPFSPHDHNIQSLQVSYILIALLPFHLRLVFPRGL
jgi:hypothetical protein